MVIDTTMPEFADVPESLNGEVLLQRPAQGGFLTATIETCRGMKTKTAAEKQAAGWVPYQPILDALAAEGII